MRRLCVVWIAVGLALLGCDLLGIGGAGGDPQDGDEQPSDGSDQDDGAASLSLTLSAPAEWAIEEFVLELTGPSGFEETVVVTDATHLFTGLVPAEYDLTVTAVQSGDSPRGRVARSYTLAGGEVLTDTVEVAFSPDKYSHPDYYPGIDITGNGHPINRAPQTIWTYTRNESFVGRGVFLWGMNATDSVEEVNFGFAIDETEPVLLDEDGETLVYTAGASDLSIGKLVYDGFERVPLANPAGSHQDVLVRLTVQVRDLSGAPLALAEPTVWDLEVEYGGMLEIEGDFQVLISLDGSTDGGSTWTPVLDLYDTLDTIDGISPRTDIGTAVFVLE